jgi:hypothetical protein
MHHQHQLVTTEVSHFSSCPIDRDHAQLWPLLCIEVLLELESADPCRCCAHIIIFMVRAGIHWSEQLDLGGRGFLTTHEISFRKNRFHSNPPNICPSKITRYTVVLYSVHVALRGLEWTTVEWCVCNRNCHITPPTQGSSDQAGVKGQMGVKGQGSTRVKQWSRVKGQLGSNSGQGSIVKQGSMVKHGSNDQACPD